MNYSKSLLLHEDRPAYGIFLKLILLGVPGIMLVAGITMLFSAGNSEGWLLILETAFIGIIFWFVFPRSYRIYEDHLRIVMGGPFSVKVGFDKVEKVAVSSRFTLSINFVTRFTNTCVEIARKNGMSIAITPRDYDLFIEKASQALIQWTEMNKNNA